MILYSIFPVEVVDMIYLRTNFFTALEHIPLNDNVVKKLFDREVLRCHRRGNWKYINKHRLSIETILQRSNTEALMYFKKNVPCVYIDYKMFVYDDDMKINTSVLRNNILISVFKISDDNIRHHENNYKRVVARCLIDDSVYLYPTSRAFPT